MINENPIEELRDDIRLELGRRTSALIERIVQILGEPEFANDPNALSVFFAAIKEVKRRCDKIVEESRFAYLKEADITYLDKEDVADFIAMDSKKAGKC